MNNWKKYIVALTLFIIFLTIFFIANGALKMVSIDKTLADVNEMREVISEYLAGDIENTSASEVYFKVEEIYNRDRWVKRGTPQEANRNDYDVGNIEDQMDFLKTEMSLMNYYDSEPKKKIEIAERIKEYMKIAEVLMRRM